MGQERAVGLGPIKHTPSGNPYVEAPPQRCSQKEEQHLRSLGQRIDLAETFRQRMSIYAAMSEHERMQLAAFCLEKASGKRLTRLAPPGMFPPTVYGAEAKDMYEQQLADDQAIESGESGQVPR